MIPKTMKATSRPQQWTPAYQPRLSEQAEFHQDRYRYRLRGLLAGQGGGKTLAGAVECIVISQTHPRSKGLAAAPNYPQIERGLYEPFESEWLFDEPVESWDQVPIVASWNQSKRKLRFTNGSELWFVTLEEPEKIEAPNIDYYWMDEAQALRAGQFDAAYDALDSRLRGGPGGYEGAWITTHSPPKPLAELFTPGEGHAPNSKRYRWTTHDAYEAGLITESSYQSMTSRHHGAAAKARLEGRYARPEGQVFSTFDPDEHVRRPKWVEERTWEIAHGGADWGWTHPACLGVGLQKGERIHVIELVHEDHLTKSQLADEAAAATQRYGVAKWWCDSSDPENIRAFQERGLAAEGCPKVGPADRRDTLVDRFNGGTLTVDPSAQNLIEQLLMLEETDRKTGKPWKDGPDHAVDMAGYLVVRADRAVRIRAE